MQQAVGFPRTTKTDEQVALRIMQRISDVINELDDIWMDIRDLEWRAKTRLDGLTEKIARANNILRSALDEIAEYGGGK